MLLEDMIPMQFMLKLIRTKNVLQEKVVAEMTSLQCNMPPTQLTMQQVVIHGYSSDIFNLT